MRKQHYNLSASLLRFLSSLSLFVFCLLALSPTSKIDALSSSTVCNTPTTQNTSIGPTELIHITKTHDDGLGNYTLIQKMSDPTSADSFENILKLISNPSNRVVEDVGPGFLSIYLWGGQMSNITRVSPTEIQFDITLNAITVPGLPNPCLDPIDSSNYLDSAVTLNSIYSSHTIGVPSPNSGTALDFIVTTYSTTTTYYDEDGDGEKSNIDPDDNDKCATTAQTACQTATPKAPNTGIKSTDSIAKVATSSLFFIGIVFLKIKRRINLKDSHKNSIIIKYRNH